MCTGWSPPHLSISNSQISHQAMSKGIWMMMITICTSNRTYKSATFTAATVASSDTTYALSYIPSLPIQAAHKPNTSSINVDKKLAIGNSGTTGDFIMEDAPVTNEEPIKTKWHHNTQRRHHQVNPLIGF